MLSLEHFFYSPIEQEFVYETTCLFPHTTPMFNLKLVEITLLGLMTIFEY